MKRFAWWWRRMLDRRVTEVRLCDDGRHLYLTQESPTVRIEKISTQWVASMKELNIYECGKDEDDAYDAVIAEIRRLWLSLEEKRRTDELDTEDEEMQARLEKLFTLHDTVRS